MIKYLLTLCFLSPMVYSIEPIDYSINVKSPYQSTMDGWRDGFEIGRKYQNSKQKKELHQAKMTQIEREAEYRNELKSIYEEKEIINNDDFQKLLILYPEFTETTLKLKESFGKIKED